MDRVGRHVSLGAGHRRDSRARRERVVQHHGKRAVQPVREGPPDWLRGQHALRSRGYGPRPHERPACGRIGLLPRRARRVPLHGSRGRAGMDGRQLPRDLLSELHEPPVPWWHVDGHVLYGESQPREPKVRPRVGLGIAKDRHGLVVDPDDERERERAGLPPAGLLDQPDRPRARRDEPPQGHGEFPARPVGPGRELHREQPVACPPVRLVGLQRGREVLDRYERERRRERGRDERLRWHGDPEIHVWVSDRNQHRGFRPRSARTNPQWLATRDPASDGLLPSPVHELNVTVDYYQAVDAPWLNESASNLSLGPGGTASLGVTVSVPANQPYGILS